MADPAAAAGRFPGMAFVAAFLGRWLADTYEIVELVEGERVVMRTAKGPGVRVGWYLGAPGSLVGNWLIRR